MRLAKVVYLLKFIEEMLSGINFECAVSACSHDDRKEWMPPCVDDSVLVLVLRVRQFEWVDLVPKMIDVVFVSRS